jgi:seryl-tRNA synthetase
VILLPFVLFFACRAVLPCFSGTDRPRNPNQVNDFKGCSRGWAVDDEVSERIKAIKRELRELGEDVEQLRKRKANGEDVDQIVSKVTAIETEMRTKFQSLSADSQEVRHALQKLVETIEHLRTDLSTHKREIAQVQDSQKISMWARIPAAAWVFMAVGVFAVLQLGLERWAEFQGMGR